ncbi:cell division protein FtsB [Pokkaliibacter plantistimulans]|uniref:Cell division protein FtsB n=2 Tax=Pseudomonadota TaxID=1224 RepID=A0ABX5M1Z4_9GAMM|nr:MULTISPECIES: cell division protein FtsB [Pokkaliibacter]MDH2434576.1 cell division protein FtsB [Pokkaliibacter sp. MBI-7]PPC74879.1 cell division protein FtsB [Pokkaliibacter plantistimulans]PXF32902.1 cell division protein FtsB [Pokkaliibacter plantistimulans]
MKRLVLVLLLLCAGLQYRLWWGEGSLPDLWALKDSIQQQRQLNERLEHRNNLLEAEVDDLKQGMAAIEERARSELGMIREGETYYLLLEPEKQP